MLPGVIRPVIVLVALALVAPGCAQKSSEPARLGLKLAPSALGASVNLQQQIRVERGGRVENLQAVLEVDAERVDLVGLALEQRVLSLHYDGRVLQSWRHPMLPAKFRSEDVLEDLQLALWPAEAIRQALPQGWRIEEHGRRRTLLLDDQPVMEIDYSGEPRWIGKIDLANLRYHYRLTIESASSGP